MKRTVCFILFLCSTQLFAKESFMNFDFIDGQIENGLDNWSYSDLGETLCDVYNGKSQSKLCSQNGQKIYAYYNGSNTDHIGWMRYGYIDSSNEFSVNNTSLKLQMTGGVYKNAKGNNIKVGIPARAKSERFTAPLKIEDEIPETLPGDMSIYVKTATNTTTFSQFQGKNRFSVWVLMPYLSLDINEYSTAHLRRPNQRIGWYPFIEDSRGGHYYHHASNIPMGGWTKVQFDAHPTHHNSGSHNSYSAFSAGGYEYPGKSESYFNNIVTFALRTSFSRDQPISSQFYLDEFEVDLVEFENDETINNIGVGFNPETQQFDISFEDKYRCSNCSATYILKYSFTPITNHNFEDAHTPSYITNFNRSKNNNNGKIFKPNPGYNLLWAAIDLQDEHKKQLTNGRKIYFAVKDISSRENITQQTIDTETIEVPGLGEIRNIDLIKSIEYKIIPVNYPLQIKTEIFNEAVAGQKYEQSIESIGGTKPYTYSASNLPNGLKLTSYGKLIGTPLVKGNNEVVITIIDAKNNILNTNINLEVFAPDDFNVEFCKLLVDLKSSAEESVISDVRFNEIFKDAYTGFYDVGTTITVGSNKNYDYLGVKGSGFELLIGDKVRLVWKNIGTQSITFAPRISFSQQGRYKYDEQSQWLYSSSIKIEPGHFGTSELVIEELTESSSINVNVNHENNKTLILDKIELIEQRNFSSDLCKRVFDESSLKTYVIADFENSINDSQTDFPNLSNIIKDRYTDFWNNGMATVIGSNGSYNFQGVTGSGYKLVEGDQILVTWTNQSDNVLDLTPLLSIKSPLRVIDSKIGEWHVLDKLVLSANSTGISKFQVTEEFAGVINVVNVSNAKSVNKTLTLDKIELISASEPFYITTNEFITGTQNKLLSQQLVTNNYESDVFFETTSYLPIGLFLSSEGKLEGNPEEYGQFKIEVNAFVNTDVITSKKFDITITPEIILYSNHCKVLVDFNGVDNNQVIESNDFHTVIHDIYTGSSSGIGMTNLIGYNKNYNYQGILGKFTPKSPSNKIRTVWYNNSETLIEFTPRISLTHFGRVGRDPTYYWSFMEKITISPKEYMVSNFNLDEHSGSIYDGININVNYTNNNQLILDKIEYVDIDISESQTCVLPEN